MINNKVQTSDVSINTNNKEIKDFNISIDNTSKIFEANIDIYVNKYRFLTEIVSNSYDAIVEKAIELGVDKKQYLLDNPIIISLKEDQTTKDYTLSIKETSGIGISQERMDDIFLYLNKSTKENSEDYIGHKGKGNVLFN